MNHQEEIIGMLIGEWQGLKNTNPFVSTRALARIHAVSLLTRSDKRKDRVEIAPEQLHLAAEAAEELAKRNGKNMRVIGWYHSHPHITVFPSHVGMLTRRPLHGEKSALSLPRVTLFSRLTDTALLSVPGSPFLGYHHIML
ncbi:JAB1/Mov34/MPN/PAD-1 ubiquitin protease-domain-containing protein [Dichotomocladium elegans]|nr:JAB1/Mov34/MPN/PAD-1 ubiquitin protease-domain-containing protein [Dichotomocladium elegans]